METISARRNLMEIEYLISMVLKVISILLLCTLVVSHDLFSAGAQPLEGQKSEFEMKLENLLRELSALHTPAGKTARFNLLKTITNTKDQLEDYRTNIKRRTFTASILKQYVQYLYGAVSNVHNFLSQNNIKNVQVEGDLNYMKWVVKDNNKGNVIINGKRNSMAGDWSIIVGDDNNARGANNLLLGNGNSVEGNNALIYGDNHKVKGDYHIVLGNYLINVKRLEENQPFVKYFEKGQDL